MIIGGNMPANNEDFNKIENEDDFEVEQGKLEASYEILVELATVTHVNQNKSTWEKNQIAFFKCPEISSELRIPPPIVGAYYFAKKIMSHLDPKSMVEYETYTELLAVCKNWQDFDEIERWNNIAWNKDGKDLNRLEELIVKYIEDNQLNILLGPLATVRGTVDIWCTSFCDTYKKIMSATQKYIDNKTVSGDSMHPHYRLGNAAIILEFLYNKCFAKNISLIELQNMFINEYVLPATDGKGLGFSTETQYTLAEIISFNQYELVAWFITNEMLKVSPLQHTSSEKDELFQLLAIKCAQYRLDPKEKKTSETLNYYDKKFANENTQNYYKFLSEGSETDKLFHLFALQCIEYIENTNGRMIKEVVAYYAQKLTKEKNKRNFSEANMFVWLKRAQSIMEMYDFVKGKILENIPPAEDYCRGMVLSDSVGVGYGLAQEKDPDRQCYVRSIARLLKMDITGVTVDLANCSVIGYETIDGRTIIKRELNAIKPHFVLISLGGNDARQDFRIETIRENLEAIVAECIQTTKVVVALGIPETFPADEKYRKEFAAILPVLKKKYNIATIWLPEQMLRRENIQADGLHLKPNIQLPLAKLAVESISPVLNPFQLKMYPRIMPLIKKQVDSEPLVELIMGYLYKNYSPAQQSTMANETTVKNKPNGIISRFFEGSNVTTTQRGYFI